jgi:hypothetical protein
VKLPAHVLIDDRVLVFSGSYPAVDKIISFQPALELENDPLPPRAKGAYGDAGNAGEARLLHSEEHICQDCVHRSVCKMQLPEEEQQDMLVTISRCRAYVPFVPEVG